LANQLHADYAHRGLQIIHVIIESGAGGSEVNWEDALYWKQGNNDAFPALDPGIIVLADDDYQLWTRFLQDCSVIPCVCNYTPQYQIIDQGGVTVSDPCAVPPGGSDCYECGYNHEHVQMVLDGILPDEWCGESTP